MGKRTNNQLPNNLPQLQNCIKKDPDSYKEEVSQCENIKVNTHDIFNSSFNNLITSKLCFKYFNLIQIQMIEIFKNLLCFLLM